MPSQICKSLQLLFIACFIFFVKPASAQTSYHNIIFKTDSLINVGLPKSALKEVDKLDALARRENNAPQMIRAVIYHIKFQTYLQEDALVNVIDTLKADINRSAYPVKPVLQSFLADMYWQYYQENRYQFTGRSKLGVADADFRKWDLATIIGETNRLYQLSLQDADKEQNTPIDILDIILDGDKNTRVLRPTLYDLLLHRAFNYFLAEEPAITKPKMPFSVNDARLFSDGKTFAGLDIKTSDTGSTIYHGIRLLQQGIAFHSRKKDSKALADLDLKRLTFLYGKATFGKKNSLYLAALKRVAADTAAGAICADALFAIGKFYFDEDSLTTAMVYLKKAIADYPKSPGAQNSGNQISAIMQKTLTVTLEDVNSPSLPILAQLSYRNIKTAQYKIYQLTDAQFALLKKTDGDDDVVQPGTKTLAFIQKLKALQEQQLSLPLTTDFKEHNTEFKIDELKPGTYLLLAKQGTVKDSLIQIRTFKVSGLAYIIRTRPDHTREIKVTARETGDWIKDARVTINYPASEYGSTKKKASSITGNTDDKGAFIFNDGDSQYTINISYQDDHLVSMVQYDYYSPQPWLNNEIITYTRFFTDRQIYRPGQTIFFNALQIQNVNGKSIILPHADLDIEFRDQNRKQLGIVKLKTNEFGTAASSFIIPQNVLNGWINISTPKGDISVQVEEYKRPTFQVKFDPFIKNYRLNDSVTVTGKINAFSGYGLSGARVAYHITGNPDMRFMDDAVSKPNKIYRRGYATNEVATDTIKTDEQGRFEFKFLAAATDAGNINQSDIFNISADVTDANSETQSANTTIRLSARPVELETGIPEKIIAKKGTTATINIYNSNHQKQNGKANVQVYPLKGPAVFYKERLWDTPDQWMMSKDSYLQNFPNFAYKHEDVYKNWQQLAKTIDIDMDLDRNETGKIDITRLSASPAGIYKIIISAKNENGDTTSVIKYINVIADAAPVQKKEDWVIPVNTTVRPDEAAEFYVGINRACKVLMETYDGPKILSTQLLNLNAGGPQKITVPVVPTTKNSFSVQFMLINGNRRYTSYTRVVVTDTVRPLNIKFLTMRNKLQPGEKEQWKVQITGNDEKQSAELLAAMYDASLDDITPAVTWQQDFNNTPYINPYYQWAGEPLSTAITTFGNESGPDYYPGTERIYETLNMQGFNYYGSNNDGTFSNYQETIATAGKRALSNKKIEALYLRSATQVKNGYDVVGRVLYWGSGLSGIRVKIGNSVISTVTNSLGYFKIKVPLNSVLLFSAKNFASRKISPPKGLRLIVNMKTMKDLYRELHVSDPGAKNQKGDPNADIRIDEPVGNSDVKQVAEEAPNYMFSVAGNTTGSAKGYLNYAAVRFPPPVVKPDMEGKAKDILKEVKIVKPISIRKNFNETAFFYPQLHTDDKGQILIDFTIPESLTRWKFRGFAHNKLLQTGYIEQEIITQKKMMISANMPRFLREGDTLLISARVVNLTTTRLKGQAKLELFNAINMQPVNLLSKAKEAEQTFELDSSSTGAVTYKLIIPAGLEALTYRLTASAGNYTDGEENTLPVLPNSMPVTETMPMMVRPGQTKAFTFNKLINQSSNTLKSKTLTLEYTQNPAWTAVQSLPYLMEFPYECSEQIFSRYYANSFAVSIVNHYPKIKQVFEQWKITDSKTLLSNLEKNPELKAVLLEETPWLQDALSETEHKKRIALLLDLNKMTYELDQNLTKLAKKQLPGGAFPWFGGEYPDRYITQHVLAGIGQLNKLNISDKSNTLLAQVGVNAIKYLVTELKADEASAKKYDKKYQARNLEDLEIHAWYALSYFSNANTDGDEAATVKKNYINRAVSQWTSRSEFEQSMIAITLYRWGNRETAAAIIKSLQETAQQSDELGMYWAANKPGYYWYQSPVETQALMIELFTEAGNNPTAVNEMKIWLLRNKQTSNWRSTKATAAACYALLMKGGDLLSNTSSVNIKLNDKPLAELKPELKTEAGTGSIKTTWADEQVKPALGHVQINNSSKSINWGAMYWRYTEKLDKITSSNTNVQLERKYFIQKLTDAGAVLTAVDAAHQPKTGDILKVVIYLKADRDFDYIQLKDLRPAGSEPVDALSAYKYQDGLYYYQVSKDVATNFFISQLKKGNYVFEYQLRVAQSGNYATGITSLQSMYAPEFNAHSEGGRITFKP